MMHALNAEFVEVHPSPVQGSNGLSLKHARPIGTSGPPFHNFGTGSSTLPSMCGVQGCSSMTGAAIVIDQTQGTPPQSFPSAIALFCKHVPSHPVVGSKFVLIPPPPRQTSELKVHVVGKLHLPSGVSHEHFGHENSGGAGLPSNATFGASSGHAGGTTSSCEGPSENRQRAGRCERR